MCKSLSRRCCLYNFNSRCERYLIDNVNAGAANKLTYGGLGQTSSIVLHAHSLFRLVQTHSADAIYLAETRQRNHRSLAGLRTISIKNVNVGHTAILAVEFRIVRSSTINKVGLTEQ